MGQFYPSLKSLSRAFPFKKFCAVLLVAACSSVSLVAQQGRGEREVWGPRYKAGPNNRGQGHGRRGNDALSTLLRWNQIAIDASGLDHTPVAPGETRVFGEQLGPGRSARAMAIVHIAMFEAVNAIEPRYQSFLQIPRATGKINMEAAIACAAHDTLVQLFPSQASTFDALFAEDLDDMKPKGKEAGIAMGQAIAAGVMTLRGTDGSQHPEPRVNIDYIPSNLAGKWRQDPISLIPLALGAHWGEVEPFVLLSTSQFRVPPPPDMTSAEYATAFNEVKRLGGDGVITPTDRNPEQTQIGIFWAYDGTPSLCAPPRLYNQIATQIADQKHSSVSETARLLALVNTAMADAGTSSWESKYYWAFWRPITGIREADPGTGPTGTGDDNAATVGDPTFSPLGAPASNLQGPNFTPPFPAYPSGHAVFGGALFQTLRRFYGTDRIPFKFVSDEFNGITAGNDNVVRPRVERRFRLLSEAEEENGQSRIYLGIHWAFDKTAGIAQGRQVADYVFDHAFRPLP